VEVGYVAPKIAQYFEQPTARGEGPDCVAGNSSSTHLVNTPVVLTVLNHVMPFLP
jgi:hypothetical protein